jgi:hypothetical protein
MVARRMLATTTSDIVAWAEANGFTAYWPKRNLRVRRELQLQPSIAGLVGPMYDGTDANGLPVIRYEDQKSYNVPSA